MNLHKKLPVGDRRSDAINPLYQLPSSTSNQLTVEMPPRRHFKKKRTTNNKKKARQSTSFWGCRRGVLLSLGVVLTVAYQGTTKVQKWGEFYLPQFIEESLNSPADVVNNNSVADVNPPTGEQQLRHQQAQSQQSQPQPQHQEQPQQRQTHHTITLENIFNRQDWVDYYDQTALEAPVVFSIADIEAVLVQTANNTAHTHKITSHFFCLPWSINSDAWWSHHPQFEVFAEDITHTCFRKIIDLGKRRMFEDIYNVQFGSSCDKVNTRRMWSSGLASDLKNVMDGLAYARESEIPFALTKEPWHYAKPKMAPPDSAIRACPSEDMFCYFLPLSNCTPGEEANDLEVHTDKHEVLVKEGSWIQEYATRQQTWFRKAIIDYMHSPPLEGDWKLPCTTIHVRRSDVVLHGKTSRRYFPLDDYLKTHVPVHNNILLLTDDHNVLGEARSKHPQHNWIYLNRTRFQGTEGGWENQLPSMDPTLEMTILYSLLRWVKSCDSFIRSSTNFGDMLQVSMQNSNASAAIGRVEELYDNEEVHSIEHSATKSISVAYDESGNPIVPKTKAPLSTAFLRDPQGNCDYNSEQKSGVIVMNTMNEFGFNLFEFAMARRLAEQLCWKVAYRTGWLGIDPTIPILNQCFPRILHTERAEEFAQLPVPLQQDPALMEIKSPDLWPKLWDKSSTPHYDPWQETLKASPKAKLLLHGDPKFLTEFLPESNNYINSLVQDIQQEESNARVLVLGAFYFHYDWMQGDWLDPIKSWAQIDDECCSGGIPDEETVVIYWSGDLSLPNLDDDATAELFVKVLERQNLQHRPVWIVCRSEVCKSSEVVVRLATQLASTTQVVFKAGDPYEGFCILQRARTLILSYEGVMAQFAAVTSQATQVHYLRPSNYDPNLSLVVPEWQYHEVDATSGEIVSL